ncbi:RIM13 [Candida theae]|uniref:Cysteine protease RIM13 n=1 Tax=Candida theae TaxID=1198502 RepID=A0AAD5BH96_9ASCO|nr:RIM13 [Candida theae]KAI5963360.1 RIM13 [Candida theae]
MSLVKFLHHIQRSNLLNSIEDYKRAKSEAIDAIKELNLKAKDSLNANAPFLKTLSEFALQNYERVQQKQPVSVKLLWLASKAGDTFFFPVIDFGEEISSASSIFIEDDCSAINEDESTSAIEVPLGMDVRFEAVATTHWQENKDHLLNLFQDLLTNCSFVSSYLALTSVGFSTYSLISPHSTSKVYKVALTFNGSKRLVDVGDRLPRIVDSNRNLILKSFTDLHLYWPALIEKAYLQVMGHGYCFKGSNMANDTYMLSGWLPEVVKLSTNRSLSILAQLWQMRTRNQVTLGIGTESFSDEFSSSIGLTGEHDYVIEDFDGKCITLKNPWVTDDISTRLVKVDSLTHFKYLYINWKPRSDSEIFQEIFIYTLKEDHIVDQPQFTIECDKETWLLLEKHLPVDENHWMRINVYKSRNKVVSPFDNDEHSVFETNNRLQLIKLPPGIYTLVIWSNNPGRYSLASYGTPLYRSVHQFPHLQLIHGEWVNETCGGNWTVASYINNPHYDLNITKPTTIKLVLNANALVNFDIFFADKLKPGQRIRSYNKTKCLSVDKYSQDYQSKLLELERGLYKIVVSNFDGSPTKLKLLLNSSEAVSIDKIPSTMSLYSIHHTFYWNQKNRYKLFFKTSVYNTSIIVKVRHTDDENALYGRQTDYRPALRASIFNAATKEPVQINQEFRDDCLYGLFVEETLLEPGEYILLIERFEIGKGRCDVVLGSDQRMTLL